MELKGNVTSTNPQNTLPNKPVSTSFTHWQKQKQAPLNKIATEDTDSDPEPETARIEYQLDENQNIPQRS